jgi:hypothetical protein
MPWSFWEYQTVLARILQQQFKTYEIKVGKQSGEHAVIGIPVEEPHNIIATELETYHAIFQDLHQLTENSLRANLSPESVLMFFDFADEVKVPCEQYLLYFTQFLKDLGVEAQTALTNEAGHVLFTVTPNDETEALDKIRTALDVYLHLPSSPIRDATNESVAVQRLEANIFRLRGDLKLAAAELQAKETTVEAQRLIIDVQKAMLNGEILVDSMKDVAPKPEDKEYLIDGLVALSTYQDKGFAINLGEILRRLKQLFAKDK